MNKEEYWLFTFSCTRGITPAKITQIFDCFPDKEAIERELGTTDYAILFMTPITKQHAKLLLGQETYD
jgi:hypothetical protein